MEKFFNIAYLPLKLLLLGRKIISFSGIKSCEDGSYKQVTKNMFGKKAFVSHNCYSISKSVVTLAMGFLFDEGKLIPTDLVKTYLGDYFPDGYDKGWDKVTLNDLFHHKTGAADAVDLDITDASLWKDKEYLHTLFGYKITGKTGYDWHYCDGNYYILGRVFEKVAGEDVYSFLSRKLFYPMGFYYDMWATDSNGHVLGGTGLYLRTKDLAKLGALWLNDGVFDGKRYISKEWIDLATIPSEAGDNRSYGFGVRTIREGVFSITGMYGQGIYINRTKKLVYAFHSTNSTLAITVCDIASHFVK